MQSATSKSLWPLCAAALAGLAALCPGAAPGQSTAGRGLPVAPPSEARILMAVQRGIQYLYRTQNADGTWTTRYARQHPGGMACLGVLAAMSTGQSPDAPGLKRALEYAKGLRPKTVYARAMRTMVYARLPGNEYALRTEADAKWLMEQQDRSGGWGYGPDHATTRVSKDWTDASNSQMALLALREAFEQGVAIPDDVWLRAIAYWTRAQNSDGGWGYEPPGRTSIRLRGSSYGSMTAAGIATFHIFADVFAGREAAGAEAAQPGPVGRKQRRAAQAWLAGHYAVDEIPGWSWGKRQEWLYYYLFCLARVSDAGGAAGEGAAKRLAQIASFLLSRQNGDGSWGDQAAGAAPQGDPVHTCFALLTLVKVSAPVLISKLAVGDARDTHPDASNFARWFSRRFAQAGTWQFVGASPGVAVLNEAPLLLIRGQGTFTLPASLNETLRGYLQGPGTVLVQAFSGDEAYARTAEKYFLGLLAGDKARPCPKDHPIFNAAFKIPPEKQPTVRFIGNRSRAKVFIASTPLAGYWHTRRPEERLVALQVGANLIHYATARRLAKTRFREKPVAAAPIRTDRYIPVARIKHAGDWNANPLAMARLNNVVAQAISIGVRQTAEPVDLSGPVPDEMPLLWLTGSDPPEFSALQLQRLEQYLYGGGTLFVDAAVGDEAFATAARDMLVKAFGAASLQPLLADSPVLTGEFGGGLGSRIGKVEYTPPGGGGPGEGPTDPRLLGVVLNERLAVIFSPLGVTGPMEGSAIFACHGLKTRDSLRLAANVVLYATVTKPTLRAAGKGPSKKKRPPKKTKRTVR